MLGYIWGTCRRYVTVGSMCAISYVIPDMVWGDDIQGSEGNRCECMRWAFDAKGPDGGNPSPFCPTRGHGGGGPPLLAGQEVATGSMQRVWCSAVTFIFSVLRREPGPTRRQRIRHYLGGGRLCSGIESAALPGATVNNGELFTAEATLDKGGNQEEGVSESVDRIGWLKGWLNSWLGDVRVYVCGSGVLVVCGGLSSVYRESITTTCNVYSSVSNAIRFTTCPKWGSGGGGPPILAGHVVVSGSYPQCDKEVSNSEVSGVGGKRDATDSTRNRGKPARSPPGKMRIRCGFTKNRMCAAVCVMLTLLETCEAKQKVMARHLPTSLLEPLTAGKANFGNAGNGEPELVLRQTIADISRRQPGKMEVETEKHGLSIVTVNSTSWGAAKKFIMKCKADVILVQEHKLCSQDDVDTAKQWADGQNWTMVMNVADGSTAKNASAGVAILVRRGIGIQEIQTPTNLRARFVAATIQVQGNPNMVVGSVYMKTGIAMTGMNLDILAAAAHVITEWAMPTTIGGDFNCHPSVLKTTGVLEETQATIVAPAHAGGTCTAGKTATLLDYFLVSRMENAIQNVDTVRGTSIKTHRPVELTMWPDVKTLRRRKVKMPPVLNKEIPFGPRNKQEEWGELHSMMHDIYLAAMTSDGKEVLPLYDYAYGLFADKAELELAAATGTELTVVGTRGRAPMLVWAPIVDAPKPPLLTIPEPVGSRLEKMQALRDLCLQLQNVISKFTRGEGELRQHVGSIEEIREAIMRTVPDATWRTPQEGGDDLNSATKDVIRRYVQALECAHAAEFACDWYVQGVNTTETARGTILHNLAEHLVSAARDTEEGVERIHAEEVKRAWRKVLTPCGKAAGKRAFLATQLPKTWLPDSAEDEKTGIITGDPVAVVEKHRAKFARMWKAKAKINDDIKLGARWGGGTALDILTVEELRAAARTFKLTTSSTYDGIHPRLLEYLSDDGLATLAVIYQIAECLGTMPPSARTVAVSLIPKPNAMGEVRPIGIGPGVTRLYTKSRQPMLDAWEDQHRKEFLAAGKGVGSVDAVWRQALDAEAAVMDGGCAAAILWDLSAFFDSIDHQLLGERAAALGWPPVLINMALSMYSAPRVISSRDAAAAPLCPTQGVMAGCSFAKACVTAYYVEALEKFTKAHEEISLDAFIDDFTLSAAGSSEEQVENDLVKGAIAMHKVIKEELKCSVSLGKAAVVASSEALGAKIRARLGELAGKPVEVCTNLGIDYKAGRRRGRKLKGTKRGQRFARGKKRVPRLRNLRTILGSRIAGTLYASGIQPAMDVGAEVNGVSNTELHTLQKIAGVASAAAVSGRSLRATLILRGNPTWKPAVAPALKWHREIWHASSSHFNRGGRRLTTAQMESRWITAAKGAEECSRQDGSQNWSMVRGPVAATILSLERIGWRAISPTLWEDDLGIQRELTKFAPKVFETIMRHSVQRGIEREMAKDTGDPNVRSRVTFDIPQNYVRAKAHSKKAKIAVGAVATNALWTLTRLKDAGYVVDSTKCALCHTHEDTLHHRVWCCQHPDAVRERNKVCSMEIQNRARAAGPVSILYNHGVMQHPGDDLPQAADTVCWAYARSADQTLLEMYGAGLEPTKWLSGSVYTDGHATKKPIKELNRAAWAAAEINEAGELTAYARGTVPRAYPQTAQCSEYFAAASATSILGGETTFTIDNLNVVRDLQKPREMWGKSNGAYAAIMKSIQGFDKDNEFLQETRKIKSHMKVSSTHSDELNRDIKGNAFADEHAAKGALGHPTAATDVQTKVDRDIEDCIAAVKVIGNVLPLWPWASHKHVRKAKETTAEVAGVPRVPAEEKHKWIDHGDRWRCGKCRATTRGRDLPKARIKQRCRGLPNQLAKDSELGSRRHDVIEVASKHGDFSICRSCGRYGMRRGNALMNTCDRETRTRRTRQAWSDVFEKGLHPYTRQPFGHDTEFTATEAALTRDSYNRASRGRRLSCKTKPWVAAAVGVTAYAEATFEDTVQDDDERRLFQGDVDMDGYDYESFFNGVDLNASESDRGVRGAEADAEGGTSRENTNQGHTVEDSGTLLATPEVSAVIPPISQAQRELIAANKEAAVGRKRARELLAADNRRKASETKKRRTELDLQKRIRDFKEWRKIHDNLYCEEVEEAARKVPRVEDASGTTGAASSGEWPGAGRAACSNGETATDIGDGAGDNGGGCPSGTEDGMDVSRSAGMTVMQPVQSSEGRCGSNTHRSTDLELAEFREWEMSTGDDSSKELPGTSAGHDEEPGLFYSEIWGNYIRKAHTAIQYMAQIPENPQDEVERTEKEDGGALRDSDSDTLSDTEPESGSILVCKRSVCSTDTAPCTCPACATVSLPAALDQEGQHVEIATTTEDDADSIAPVPVICGSCGHDESDSECCRQQHAAKRLKTAVGGARAGERQRQETSRILKEQLRRQEAASLRPRSIVSTEEATTPAQRILARMKDRVTNQRTDA